MIFDTLTTQIIQYLRFFPNESPRLSNFLDCVTGSKDVDAFLSRSHFPWHITASGIVFDPISNAKIIVIKHPYINLWLPPGGHIEPGESPQDAAIREVHEEVGLTVSFHKWHVNARHPFDIDVHPIPANSIKREPKHLHCDFRYLLASLDDKHINAELINQWRTLSELSFAGARRLDYKLTRYL